MASSPRPKSNVGDGQIAKRMLVHWNKVGVQEEDECSR